MDSEKFKKLLQLNRELSNTLETMSDVEKATVRGGKVFTQLHKSDLKIAKIASKNVVLNSIIELGNY
jgi:hypothetical protein